MKKSIALLMAMTTVAFASNAVVAAEQKNRPEASMLPASEYRKPLDEIIVEAQKPYWQGESAPRWDRPKVDVPKPDDASKSRLQWAPAYTRDERDDYTETRDQVNPKPRAKIFEIKF